MPSVLFVAPSAYTLSGLATWLDYVVPGLAEQGWDVRLGLVSGPLHHRPDKYLVAHPMSQVEVAHCATGTAEGRCRALVQLLERARPDVAVSVNIPDLFVAVNRLRQRGATATHAVMTVHGIEAYLYADARRYDPMLDAVVCTNRLACALTESLGGIDRERIHYAPYGVHVPAERGTLAPEERLRIVYSGRLETPQKRAGDLVGIVRSLQRRGVPFRLEIAGDGPDRSTLETSLQAEIADGSVHFHGQLPLDELKARVYSSVHAMVITSFWETGPIVAWEAMAQGVPVVSARYVGSGREDALHDQENALLYDIGDVEGAAAALARLWHEPSTRASLSSAARRLVEDRYSIPASVQGWTQTLTSILSRPRRGAVGLPVAEPRGRLDRWLGPEAAERLRATLPMTQPAAPDAGGEWPHAHAHAVSDEAFWRLAREADREPGWAEHHRERSHVD